VAVEQASALGWERWTGMHGTIIAMRSFGASGPGRDVRQHFGFTAAAVAEAVRAAVDRNRSGSPPSANGRKAVPLVPR
jgi:transketolase